MNIRTFKPWQKFIIYEENDGDYTPHLFQVVTSRILKNYIDWLLEYSDDRSIYETNRGYNLPFTAFNYSNTQDTSYIELDLSMREVTFYVLATSTGYQIHDRFHQNTTQYFKDAVFLSNMQGYTCTALSDYYDVICWCSANTKNPIRKGNVCHRKDWHLYNELADNKENLYALQIDHYDIVQDFIARNKNDLFGQIEIGNSWWLTEQDIDLMNPHDLMFFYCPEQAYFMLDALKVEVDYSIYDDDCDYKSLLYNWAIEDEAYMEFCDKWTNDQDFKERIIELICLSKTEGYYLSKKWFHDYVIEIRNVVKYKIAPLKKIINNDSFSKAIDIGEIIKFAKDNHCLRNDDNELNDCFHEIIALLS